MSATPDYTSTPYQVKPPAAFGDWRRAARLTWTLAKTELRQRYANAWLGYTWTLLEPLLLWAVLYFVLDRVLLYGGQIEHYESFLLMNVILYFFFRYATTRGYRSIRARGGALLRKAAFPRAVLPLAAVLAAGLSYLPAVPMLFGFMLFTGVDPTWTWLLFPFVMVWIFVFALGTALLLAAIYSRIPDLEHAWRSLIRIQFWLTPVFYAISTIPDLRLRDLLLINPLSLILSEAQIWMLDPTAPGVAEVASSSGPVWIGIGITVAVCVIGPIAFALTAPKVAEAL